ncbi:MAG: hypothetical protein ABIR79_17300 [Candidatus Binatia bacterium]
MRSVVRTLFVVLTAAVVVVLGLRARIAFFYEERVVPAPVPGTVCAADGVSYPSEAAAHAAGRQVLHATACGACSNAADVEVLRRTRDTLTLDARACGLRYFLIGRGAATRCLAPVGFTPACADCWIDDMACAITHCTAICLWSRLTGEPNNVNGKLNDCLQCDETQCGPEFGRCAGANRRRSGIVSDIERPAEQIWQRQ